MDTGNIKNLLGSQASPASGSSGDIPLNHMDYDYIRQCEKIKELEKILKTLRSGKEAFYPDLIKFCEDRIADIDPNSRVLRVDKAPATKYDMDKEEWSKVNADIKDWTSGITQSNEGLSSKGLGDQKIPPVRKGAIIDTHGKKQKEDSDQTWGKPSKDRIKLHDYRKWDKYDAETEAKKIDGTDDKGQKLRDAASEISASKSAQQTPDTISVEGMSDKEREVTANREKDKGNEAFRSQDFEEAVTYYSRSISVIPSAPAFNNRALARIKLGQFKEASEDCSKVLELEPDNIKAFLRRGTALKSLQEYGSARQDLEKVMKMEPHNKQAKDLLTDLNTKEAKAKKQKANKSKESTTSCNKEQSKSTPESPSKPKGGRRLVIQEVEGSDSEEDQWEDAEEEVAKDNKPKTKEGDADSRLVNGVRGKVEGESSPTKKASGAKVPQKNDGMEVIRNLPQEESGPTENGKPDEVDGGCASRPAQEVEVGGDQQQERVKSKPVEESPSAHLNGVKDAVAVETRKEETPSAPPPAPRVERPLPSNVVRMKDEALELYKAGQYGEARDKFTQAIEKLLPDKEDFGSALASLYNNRAASSHKTGDTKACIEDCNACLEVNPYNSKVLLRRAAAYEARERYRHAYVDFQLAQSLDPLNKVAQQGTSRLVQLLREEDGSRWREKLPSRPEMPSLPKTPPILTTMAPSNATTLAYTSTTKATMTTMTSGSGVKSQEVKAEVKPEVGGSKETAKKAEPVLTKEERFQKLKDEGNAFFKKGAHSEAVRCYTACVDTDPTQAVGYTNRALCYLKLTQFQKAETDCSLALALDKNNIKALYRRSLASKSLREYKKSLQDLTTLLKLDAQNKDAKKEMDVIKDLWRKELLAAKGDSTKSNKKGKAEKKLTRIQIEESDTDSNEEKEDTSHQKSTSKAGKGSSNKKTPRNNQSKPASNPAPKLSKVTAYEFMQAWISLKGTRNLSGYADLIRQVPPTDLPKVLSNKLDGDMLGLIVRATAEHLVEKDPGNSYAILFNLLAVERFNTLVLFLSGKDKKCLRKALDHLETAKCGTCTAEDVKQLRKNYGL